MIVTVITQDGKLQAAAAGDLRWSEIAKQSVEPGQFRAGMIAEPGQTIRVVEVSDEFSDLYAEPARLMAELSTDLKGRGLL